MTTSYSVICSDFYVNQKLALKLDVPSSRETVLHMFDRVRKELPRMDRFRRYEDELRSNPTRSTASTPGWR